MEIRLLGSVEIGAGDRWWDAGPPMRRAVLAALAVDAGQPVRIETLVYRAWGDQPPDRAARTLHSYVTGIRRLLERACPAPAEPPARLLRKPGGYLLEIDPDRVDLHHGRRLVEAARAAPDDERRLVLLRKALELWRGEPLTGVSGDWAEQTRHALHQQRLDVVVLWAKTELLLGNAAALIVPLTELAGRYPLAEPLAAELMRALHAAGHGAQALDHYAGIRQRLAGELGADPSAELQQVHLAILRDKPRPFAQPAVPAQLPLDVHGFIGREKELAQLDSLLDAAGMVITVLSGIAGVGKTALAVHWAHRVRSRFPEGQLYLNLQGYAASAALRPVDALTSLLVALGQLPHRIPADTQQAAAMYRSLLADRPMLIVLDNAADADQVRPLLPGSPGSVVLVTSRSQLAGLVAGQGARPIRLGVLDHAEATGMLHRIVGETRARTEPEAIDELAALCGHLPIALRVAAANLAVRPEYTATEYAKRLRTGSRLDALTVVGDDHAAPRVAFDVSYSALTSPSRRLFRLLGLVPGPEVTVAAAAAVGGIDVAQASDLVRLLVSVHLLDETAADRYAFHDLIRLYAHERAHDTEPAGERTAAIERLCEFYLYGLDAAAGRLYAHLIRLPVPPRQPAVTFACDADALVWLESERANLVALVSHVAAAGPAEWAWRLGDAARGFFYLRMYASDWATVAAAAQAAATRDGRPQALASAELGPATLAWRQGHYREALDRFTRALGFAEAAGWQQGRMAALGSIANVLRQEGRLDEAAEFYRQLIDFGRLLGHSAAIAVGLGNLGLVQEQRGLLPEAVANYREALDLMRDTGSPSGEATLIANLGEALHHLGREDEAIEHLETALRMHQRIGHTAAVGDTMRCIAAVYADTGRLPQALALAEQALVHAREARHGLYEAHALNVLGRIHCCLGDYQQALDRYGEALAQSEHSHPRITALLGMADAYRLLGRRDDAQSHVDQTLALARQTGHRLLEGKALACLDQLHAHS